MERTPVTADALMTRRQLLSAGLVAFGGLLFLPTVSCRSKRSTDEAAQEGGGSQEKTRTQKKESIMSEYTLPPLPYSYDALEPYIDAETVRLHHDLHHAGYVSGLNAAVGELKKAREAGDYKLVDHWSRKLAFHGSGHFLHSLYWENMAPKGSGGEPSAELADAIGEEFGNFDQFKAQLSAASIMVEGSGWGILAWQPQGNRLVILQAENHQKLTQWGVIPLLVLDVWEHSYYLRYQNKRAEYVKNFWNVINWNDVSARFNKAKQV